MRPGRPRVRWATWGGPQLPDESELSCPESQDDWLFIWLSAVSSAVNWRCRDSWRRLSRVSQSEMLSCICLISELRPLIDVVTEPSSESLASLATALTRAAKPSTVPDTNFAATAPPSAAYALWKADSSKVSLP